MKKWGMNCSEVPKDMSGEQKNKRLGNRKNAFLTYNRSDFNY